MRTKLFTTSLIGVACVAGIWGTSAHASKQFAEDRCGPDEVTLELGTGFPAKGVVELLLPLPDTDGRDPVRWEASAQYHCLPTKVLSRYEDAYDTDISIRDYNALFFLTYDPEGTLYSSRSWFDHAVLMCEELSEMPKPESDLRFGRFVWTKSSGIKALRIEWVDDLRAEFERDCESY